MLFTVHFHGKHFLNHKLSTPVEKPSFNLTLDAPLFLLSTTNPLDLIAVTSMELDDSNSTVRTVGNSGIFQVGVGGEFAIEANQPNGLYTAQFDLTADYQ